MIKKKLFPTIYEYYDQSLTLKSSERLKLSWKSQILIYFTCGENNYEIECLDPIPESISLLPEGEIGSKKNELTLKKFNALHPDEPLDLKCNCHGFTFANGSFFISNEFVPLILEDEFDEVTNPESIDAGLFDILCFWSPDHNEWAHSIKYEYGMYIHKEGYRKFEIHRKLKDILSIAEYANTTPHFFKRKYDFCPGICRSAVGEKPKGPVRHF